MKPRVTVLLAILLLAGMPVFAAYEAYLKIEGVKTGPAKDPAHAGWIEAASFSWGASRANLASALPAAPRPACAEHSEFKIVKLVDVATPKLYEAAMSGAPIPSLTLDVGGERHMLLNAVLSSVHKTSLNGNAAEELTFTFQRCATHQAALSANVMGKDKTWIKGEYLKNVDQKVQTNGMMAIGGAGGTQGAIAMQDFHFNGNTQAIIVVCRTGDQGLLPYIERAFHSQQRLPELTINARSKGDKTKYMEIKLEQVFISSFTVNGNFDQIGLNFTRSSLPTTSFHDDWIK